MKCKNLYLRKFFLSTLKNEIAIETPCFLILFYQKLVLNSRNSYKDGGIYLKQKLSATRLKKAREVMRDKKENLLYKNFESLFLKA